ncbi:MAG: hypothetical protein DRJ36_04370 [Thermoprotei archaeon]|nr:MAG: hypothetical protein DRJ36_04370 [Thermoprotei archaeon]
MDKVVTKVGKKGIIVIPKKIREYLGFGEGDVLVIRVSENKLVLERYVPKRVKLGGKISEIVRDAKREELNLES